MDKKAHRLGELQSDVTQRVFKPQKRRHGADHLALPTELCYSAPAEWKTTFLLLCCYRLVPIVAGRCYVSIIQKLQHSNPSMPLLLQEMRDSYQLLSI